MYCRNCGAEMNDNQAICLKCGVKTGEGNGFCTNCGNAVAPEAAVCLNCGVAVKAPKKDGDLAGQDKVVMLIVCFFLGGLGIHNFMMGEKKKGIFKIILTVVGCGIGGIFALIDFIKIAIGSYNADPEKLI